PVFGRFDRALLEDDVALGVGDAGGPLLPLHFVVGRDAGAAKGAVKSQSRRSPLRAGRFRRLCGLGGQFRHLVSLRSWSSVVLLSSRPRHAGEGLGSARAKARSSLRFKARLKFLRWLASRTSCVLTRISQVP